MSEDIYAQFDIAVFPSHRIEGAYAIYANARARGLLPAAPFAPVRPSDIPNPWPQDWHQVTFTGDTAQLRELLSEAQDCGLRVHTELEGTAAA